MSNNENIYTKYEVYCTRIYTWHKISRESTSFDVATVIFFYRKDADLRWTQNEIFFRMKGRV